MARRRIARFFMYFFLSVGAIIMIFPFFWMFASAFKLPTEINKFPPQWLPSSLSLTNFEIAFSKAPFARYFLNSVIVMVCSVTITTFTTILGAFAFSRLKFPEGDDGGVVGDDEHLKGDHHQGEQQRKQRIPPGELEARKSERAQYGGKGGD